MNASDFYIKIKPYDQPNTLWQEHEGCYGKDDMIQFAESYFQVKLQFLLATKIYLKVKDSLPADTSPSQIKDLALAECDRQISNTEHHLNAISFWEGVKNSVLDL